MKKTAKQLLKEWGMNEASLPSINVGDVIQYPEMGDGVTLVIKEITPPYVVWEYLAPSRLIGAKRRTKKLDMLMDLDKGEAKKIRAMKESKVDEVTKEEYSIANDPYAIKIAKLMEYCQRQMNLGPHVFSHEPELEKAFERFQHAQEDLADVLQELTGKGVL